MLPAGALDGASPAEPAARSSMLPWIVLGIVTIAAAGGLVALQVVPVKNNPATANAGGAPGAPDASALAPTSPIASADKPTPIAPDAPLAPPRTHRT